MLEEKFSKANMIQKMGFEPTPAVMLDVYQQCMSRANRYLSRMNEAYRAEKYAPKTRFQKDQKRPRKTN